MIDTVIFDLGGVLVDFHPIEAMKNSGFTDEAIEVFKEKIFSGVWGYCDKLNYSDEQIRSYQKQFVPGYEEYVDKLWDNITNITSVMPYSYEWLKSLKNQGKKIYILSNFGNPSFDINSKFYTFLELADGKVISYEVKELKPDAVIYNHLIDKYNITPKNAVFIDDLEENINGAKAIGLNGIVFKSFEQASFDLNQLIK